MKKLFLLFLSVLSLSGVYGQSINWPQLTGKWELEKVVLVWKVQSTYRDKDTSDVSKDYKPLFITYGNDLKFKDEYTESNTIVEGRYNLDKTKNRIIFSDAIQTTKYPGAKVKVDDLIFKTGKQEYVVKKLSSVSFVVVHKYIPKTELQGDYIYYFKR